MTNQRETVSVRLVFQVEEPVYLENQNLEKSFTCAQAFAWGARGEYVGHLSFVFLYEILCL